MTDLRELTGKIIERLNQNNSLFCYISNNSEHAITIIDAFEEHYENVFNYQLYCLSNSDSVEYMQKSGYKIFSMNQKQIEHEVKTSAQLLEYIQTQEEYVLRKISSDDIVQTFKISSQFESQIRNIGSRLINSSAALNREIEGKITQGKLFLEAEISIPQTIIGILGGYKYEELAKTLGSTFVVQFNRGHTGSGTKFISNPEEFQELLNRFPKREVRISEYVEGKTYTVNCCMTRNGILAGGISEQMTGIPQLTSEKGGTVGNNFDHDLDQNALKLLTDEFPKFSWMFRRKGYKGMFGIDFVYNINKNKIYIIEVNARQTMSVNFHGKLQLMNDQIPLIIYHIAEFLNVDYSIDIEQYNKFNMLPISAGQLYLRNKGIGNLKLTETVRTGEYKLNADNLLELNFVSKSFSINQIERDNVLLLTQKIHSELKPSEEIARIQILDGLIENGTIKKKYLEFLSRVENRYN